MSETDGTGCRCSACKKEMKNVIWQCKNCVEFFFHPGCATKHKTYKNNELVKCKGPFERIVIANERSTTMKKTGASGDNEERTGSSRLIGYIETATNASGNTSKQPNMDAKIDWLIKTVREIRDELACKNELKTMIKQIMREELENFKQEFEEMKRNKEKTTETAGSERRSYSEAMRDKKGESILIVKSKTEQESENTKKVVKEKVDIKKLNSRDNKD